MPERLKGTGCKPVGYAYVGSNPTPSTIQLLLAELDGIKGVTFFGGDVG